MSIKFVNKDEFNKEIKEVYNEDTKGRKYHAPIVGKYDPPLKKEVNPVHSVDLNSPMTWKEFKKLPDTLKVKYLEHLRDYYKATIGCISEMFGIHRTRLSQVISGMNRQGMFGRGANPLKGKDLDKWNTFLNSGKKIPLKIEENLAEELEEFVKEKPETTVNNVVILPEPDPIPSETETNNSMDFTRCSLTFKGKFNIQDIVKKLSACIDEGMECRVNISVYSMNDNGVDY